MNEDATMRASLARVPAADPSPEFTDALWTRLAAEFESTEATSFMARLRRLDQRAWRQWRPRVCVAAAILVIGAAVAVATSRDTSDGSHLVADDRRSPASPESGRDGDSGTAAGPESAGRGARPSAGDATQNDAPSASREHPPNKAPSAAPSTRIARAGDQIVFASTRDGDYEIYIMNDDGSEVRQLTDNDWQDFHPQVSPDGRRVLYTASGADDHRHNQIYVMNIDGTDHKRLFATSCGGGDVVQEPRQPTEPTCLVWRAQWSPTGEEIVFQDGVEYGGCEMGNDCASIWIAQADGSNPRFLSNGFDPHWSPDGTRVIFVADDGPFDDAQCDVWGWVESCEGSLHVINVDGTGRVALGVRGAGPRWSPDGGAIAYSWTNDVQAAGVRQVYIMNADGTGRRQLTQTIALSGQPSWSPDGTRIAFLSQRNNNWDVYVIDVTGANERRVTTDPATEAQPDFV